MRLLYLDFRTIGDEPNQRRRITPEIRCQHAPELWGSLCSRSLMTADVCQGAHYSNGPHGHDPPTRRVATLHQEQLAPLKRIVRNDAQVLALHFLLADYATREHAEVKQWFGHRKPEYFRFITTASKLDLVERSFRELTIHQLKRFAVTRVPELTQGPQAVSSGTAIRQRCLIGPRLSDESPNNSAPGNDIRVTQRQRT
jgi:hypothetical protein